MCVCVGGHYNRGDQKEEDLLLGSVPDAKFPFLLATTVPSLYKHLEARALVSSEVPENTPIILCTLHTLNMCAMLN